MKIAKPMGGISVYSRFVGNKKKDRGAKVNLFQELKDAELNYALRYGVYRHLISGHETERGLARRKTHNRM